mmetsp:Transcript_121066/g.304442  ORF Transcript_121066/g.304442 Transcript_121066/m.304442 type:complete len:121 (+) Transcript_121066:334-696(+)
MKQVRANSEKANSVYGKAATNVATRLELLAAYKPSFLAINADHAANVEKLLQDAKEVVTAIDGLISRTEPERKAGMEEAEEVECDEEKKKEKKEEAGEDGAPAEGSQEAAGGDQPPAGGE